MVGVTVSGNPNVRAYASTKAIMLINLSKTAGAAATVSVDGASGGAGGASVYHDKALYDESKRGVWTAPMLTALPPWKRTLRLWLRPWSVTVAPLTESPGP